MDKYFIPYKEALDLKELGFDEPCLKYQWNNSEHSKWMASSNKPNELHVQKLFQEEENIYTISIPTFSQAFRFFRENYGLEAIVQRADDYIWYKWKINQYSEIGKNCVYEWEGYTSYEDAELACLKELIEIVKLQKNT